MLSCLPLSSVTLTHALMPLQHVSCAFAQYVSFACPGMIRCIFVCLVCLCCGPACALYWSLSQCSLLLLCRLHVLEPNTMA